MKTAGRRVSGGAAAASGKKNGAGEKFLSDRAARNEQLIKVPPDWFNYGASNNAERGAKLLRKQYQ